MTTIDLGRTEPGLHSVPLDYAPITPSDSTDLTYVARGIYNAGASAVDVAVKTYGSTTTRVLPIPAYTILPGFFTRVLSTGTTGGATLYGLV